MIVNCPSCQKKNRIPAQNLFDRVRCGSCKVEIPVPSEPIDVDGEALEDAIQNVSVPILVDFWAGWCGPCIMVHPFVKEAAARLAGKALVLKVNTEEHPAVAQKFRIQAIPNFLVLRDGRIWRQRAGVASTEQIISWVEDIRNSGAFPKIVVPPPQG